MPQHLADRRLRDIQRTRRCADRAVAVDGVKNLDLSQAHGRDPGTITPAIRSKFLRRLDEDEAADTIMKRAIEAIVGRGQRRLLVEQVARTDTEAGPRHRPGILAGAILDIVVASATFIVGPTDPFTSGQPRSLETVDEFKLRTFPREKISIS